MELLWRQLGIWTCSDGDIIQFYELKVLIHLFSDDEYRKLQQEISESNSEHNKGKYANVGFAYEGKNTEYQEAKPSENPDDELFKLPQNLKLPKNINLPKFQTEHEIIEKTATFLATQNIQMEILLKAKQSNNEKFRFLNFGDPMNDYYRCLKKSIANGEYRGNC